MSFYDITDPIERGKKIEALLKLTEKIKKGNYDERIGYEEHTAELEEDFKPILKGQEKMREEVVKQLQPLHQQLERIAVKQEPDLLDLSDISVDDDKVLLKNYLTKLMTRDNTIDTTFGIRYEDNIFKIGNKTFKGDDHHLLIGEQAYVVTPGLWSLITEKQPDGYSKEDLHAYKAILHDAAVLHQDFNPENNLPRASRSKKWKDILSPMWLQIKLDEGHDSDESERTLMEMENSMEDTSGSGVGGGEFLRDGKMFLRKDGMCYRVKKAHGNGLYFRKNPPYLLPGINYDGLFVKHKGRVYNGEGLILGKNSPFKNIPILGWIL